ncbi:MAG: MFS transporter [Streptosporangiaceae bacterium]
MLRGTGVTLPAALPVGDPSRWRPALAALLVADMVYGFQQTAITPALPIVQQDLGATRAWTAWLFSGYLIVASVTPVFMGKLADRSGKQRVYLAALLVFLLGSVGAALSPTIALVVIFRVIQGVGGAVFPLSFSMARDELPPGRFGMGIGLLTGGFGFGAVGGFAIGGLLAQFLSWRWIFGVGAVALALAVVLVWVTVPRSPVRTERSLDTPGALLFGGAMAALIVAITEGPSRGWASIAVVGLFVAAGVLAVAWVFRELHTDEPLIDLAVLRSRVVLLTNLSSLLNGYSLFGVNFLLPFLLAASATSTHGESGLDLAAGPLVIGLILLPRAFGQGIGGPASGPMARRFGQPTTYAAGMLIMALGAAGLAGWRGELFAVLLELGALGIGFGLAVSVSGTVVAGAASREETGVATAFNSVLRRVGGGIGAQVSAALITAITVPGTDAPAPHAFTIAFTASAVVGLAGAVLAILIVPLRGRRS